MSKICYRKNDLSLVGTVASNMSVNEEIEMNVIPNFSGVIEDYDFIETDESYFHLENIGGVITVVTDTPIITTKKPTMQEQLDSVQEAIDFLLMGGM